MGQIRNVDSPFSLITEGSKDLLSTDLLSLPNDQWRRSIKSNNQKVVIFHHFRLDKLPLVLYHVPMLMDGNCTAGMRI